MLDLENTQVSTDLDDEIEQVYDKDSRLFDLTTNLSEELLIININSAFENRDINVNNVNYINILSNNYKTAMDNIQYEFDTEIINGITFRIIEVFLNNLYDHFSISLGNTHLDGNIINMADYLNKLSALYEFFICRRLNNVKDYLIRKIFKNKSELFERYKNKLTPKESTDLFYGINKKKYRNAGDAAFLYFLDDIIFDTVEEANNADELFKYIVNIDIYEITNDKINEMLNSYGYDITYPDGVKTAADKYFSLLKNKQTYVELRNSIYLYYTDQTTVKNDAEIIFSKNDDFADRMLNNAGKNYEETE